LPCSGGRKEKLVAILPYNYIRDCSAAVCVIGKRSGALPPSLSSTMLPPGIASASYTQWEFFCAPFQAAPVGRPPSLLVNLTHDNVLCHWGRAP
jgi:hypothetical protein